jgi:hypothetical protein
MKARCAVARSDAERFSRLNKAIGSPTAKLKSEIKEKLVSFVLAMLGELSALDLYRPPPPGRPDHLWTGTVLDSGHPGRQTLARGADSG